MILLFLHTFLIITLSATEGVIVLEKFNSIMNFLIWMIVFLIYSCIYCNHVGGLMRITFRVQFMLAPLLYAWSFPLLVQNTMTICKYPMGHGIYFAVSIFLIVTHFINRYLSYFRHWSHFLSSMFWNYLCSVSDYFFWQFVQYFVTLTASEYFYGLVWLLWI